MRAGVIQISWEDTGHQVMQVYVRESCRFLHFRVLGFDLELILNFIPTAS